MIKHFTIDIVLSAIWKVWLPVVRDSVMRAFLKQKACTFICLANVSIPPSLPRVFLALKAEGVPGWWTAAWRNPLFPNGHSAYTVFSCDTASACIFLRQYCHWVYTNDCMQQHNQIRQCRGHAAAWSHNPCHASCYSPPPQYNCVHLRIEVAEKWVSRWSFILRWSRRRRQQLKGVPLIFIHCPSICHTAPTSYNTEENQPRPYHTTCTGHTIVRRTESTL